MKKAKENNGITLVSLIITIVIMLILISVTTYAGINSYRNAKVVHFVTQMQVIQGKVDELVSADEYENLGTNAASYQSTITAAYNNQEIESSSVENFKYFSINSLKDLDLEDIDTPVLVNFGTREVVAVKGVNYKNRTYYTQYKLPQGQTLVEYEGMQRQSINFTLSKEANGLNCLVNITNTSPNCTITYGEGATALAVTEWKTISNYTKTNENYSTIISKTGTYIFKIQDNENEVNPTIQTVNIITTNKPNTLGILNNYDYALDRQNWANISGYTWIPRFAYNINDTSLIKYIKGNSNIATDNTYINHSNWEIPSIFTTKGKELTGIWILNNDIIQNYETFEAQIENMETDIEKISYILANGNITGKATVSSTSHLEHEIFNKDSETIFDETNQYLIPVTGENNDPIRLFSTENINKNFIISFNKINVADDGDTYNKNTAPTLLAEMDENSLNNTTASGDKMYPGFAVKLMTVNGVNKLILESNSYTNTEGDVTIPDTTTNVRILRVDGFLYYSFDGGKFKRLNDYRTNMNPFDVPLIFGAGINENGDTFRYFKGIISDVSVKFIDDEATIDDYNPALKTLYAHEGAIQFIPDGNGNPSQMIDVTTGEAITDNYGHSGYIDTGLYIFQNETTIDEEFEISFIIEAIDSDNINQAVLVNGKFEKASEKWPGFVFRVTTKKDGTLDKVKLEVKNGISDTTTCNFNKNPSALINHKITLSMRNRILYIADENLSTGVITETTGYDFINFTKFFDTFNTEVPITIGGSLNNDGVTNQPFRGFKGTLSNIVVKADE